MKLRPKILLLFLFCSAVVLVSVINADLVLASCYELDYSSGCSGGPPGDAFCGKIAEKGCFDWTCGGFNNCDDPYNEEEWLDMRACISDLCEGGFGPVLHEAWLWCCSSGQPGCHNCSGGDCFAPGTKINTPEGEKPIENIGIGEQISSFDPKTSQSSASSVQETFQYDKDGYYQIKLKDGQELKATENHPLYSIQKPEKLIGFWEYLKTESLSRKLFDTVFK